MRLLRLETEPLLELGPPGAFDSAGMGPSVALFVGDRVFLCYIGISLRRDVPHQWAIGLAISEDGGASFRRAAPGPILSTGPFDPFFAATTHVAYQGGVFRMHYIGGVAWECHGDRFDARCLIKYARSTDGISWVTEARIALGFADVAETALARPWVVGWNDGYHMWFCRRSCIRAALLSGLRAVRRRSGLAPRRRSAAVRKPASTGRVGCSDASLSMRGSPPRRAFRILQRRRFRRDRVRLRARLDARVTSAAPSAIQVGSSNRDDARMSARIAGSGCVSSAGRKHLKGPRVGRQKGKRQSLPSKRCGII